MPEVEPVKTESTAPATPPSNTPVTNGLAIAAMVVGIVAFISGWVPFWGLLVGAAAIVLGIIALKKPTGKGMALTGIITGGLGAFTSLVFTVFFIIALAAGGAAINEAAQQADDQNTQTQEMLDAKKDFSKGETAQFGNLEIKVNSVQRNYVPDSDLYQPEEGKEYIVLNLSVKNTGDDSEYIYPYTFAVNDGGMAVDSAFVTVSPELNSGDLSQGATATGNVVYEVTEGATDLKLQYETSVLTPEFESKTIVYTLAI